MPLQKSDRAALSTAAARPATADSWGITVHSLKVKQRAVSSKARHADFEVQIILLPSARHLEEGRGRGKLYIGYLIILDGQSMKKISFGNFLF